VKDVLIKNVMNRVGRKFSFLAYASAKFRGTATDLGLVRRVFQWDPPVASLSQAAVAGNLFLAWLWVRFPTAYFVLFVCGAFFYYSDKRRALEKLAKKGPGALKRYRDLTKGENLDMDILVDDGRPATAAELKVKKHRALGGGSSARSQALQTVIRSIFNRLDRDGDGTVTIAELLDFVVVAIPRATPGHRAMIGHDAPDVALVESHARDVVNEYDADGDGSLDFDEMFAFVTNAGCARLLLQDELRRQLMTTGVPCLKHPSRFSTSLGGGGEGSATTTPTRGGDASPSHGLAFGSHQSRVSLVDDGKLAYTNRHGHPVTLYGIVSVDAHPTRPHVATVVHRGPPPRSHTKSLVLSMANVLRDPFVNTLQYELIERFLNDDKPPTTAAAKVSLPAALPPSRATSPSSSSSEKGADKKSPSSSGRNPPPKNDSPSHMAAMFSG